jgi:SagB-type dehydrogenase family enzyme
MKLPRPRADGTVSVEAALARRRSVREYAPGPLALADVSQILWSAQGVTGREGERTAPSAGATYPLELDLVAGEVRDLSPGVYRYRPRTHALTRKVKGDLRAVLAAAAYGQDWIGKSPAILVIAGVTRRTAGRYGQRAERYVVMEAGHAAENVSLAAVALEMGTVVVGAFEDDQIAAITGLGAGERPLCLLPLGKLIS